MDPELPDTIDHEDLLTLARKSEAAARDDDADRVEAASMRLLEAFLIHVGAERQDLLRLAPGDARLVRRGQQRVVDSVIELVIAAGSDGPCDCARVSQDLIACLTLQAEDERHHLAP